MPPDARARSASTTVPSTRVRGAAARPWRLRLKIWHRQRRFLLRRNPRINLMYRTAVGLIGTVVLLVGLITIPYPGPGWLTVFLGLGILATEFVWAHRLLTFARGKYDAWLEWMRHQHWSVQGIFWLGTCAVVVGTLWILGALYMAAGWVNLDFDWLASPVF